jgi:hypothetical protein
MIEPNLNQQLQELFREVGKAHHQAFIETDGADPEWPLWYANFLQGRLNPSYTPPSPKANSFIY